MFLCQSWRKHTKQHFEHFSVMYCRNSSCTPHFWWFTFFRISQKWFLFLFLLFFIHWDGQKIDRTKNSYEGWMKYQVLHFGQFSFISDRTLGRRTQIYLFTSCKTVKIVPVKTKTHACLLDSPSLTDGTASSVDILLLKIRFLCLWGVCVKIL